MADDSSVGTESVDPGEPGEGSWWAAAFVKGDEPVELTPLRLGKRRAAAAMRRVIDGLASVDAPVEALDQMADELEAIAETLEGQPSSDLAGFAEAATASSLDSFLDRSPVLGQANPIAPPIELDVADGVILGYVAFGAAYEGPPGCVHGGWIAAAFDEVLGTAQSLSGSSGMTAYLNVDYRSPTPLHSPLRFEGELDRVEGRKIFTVGRLYHGEVLTAQAEAMFVSIDFSRFAEMQRQGRPNGGSPD